MCKWRIKFLASCSRGCVFANFGIFVHRRDEERASQTERHHPLSYQWSRRTFWRCTDTTTSPKKKQERRDRGKTRTREVTRLCQVHDGGREGGSSWNSYVARRKVVGNEVIIFSGKSRQLDRRTGGEKESVSRHRESWREKRVWWTNIRSFDGAVGRSPWITNEFDPRLFPTAFFCRVDVSLFAFTREKLQPSSKVIYFIPRRHSTISNKTDDTGHRRYKQVCEGAQSLVQR